MGRPTCIDLFSGCGGLSLGLDRAGFSVLAAIDFDEHAIKTYKANFPKLVHALHKDLTKFPARELAKLIGNTAVDVIVGGPPCQGFSTARRRDGANNGPRLALAVLLRRNRMTGWRRHAPIFGKPDFVFRIERVAVFVDGCFWHCCPEHSRMPATNRRFWVKKLEGNRRRDRLVTGTLRASGWRVVRIWEHDIRTRPSVCVGRIARAMRVSQSL